jgi:hypothetical protein
MDEMASYFDSYFSAPVSKVQTDPFEVYPYPPKTNFHPVDLLQLNRAVPGQYVTWIPSSIDGRLYSWVSTQGPVAAMEDLQQYHESTNNIPHAVFDGDPYIGGELL